MRGSTNRIFAEFDRDILTVQAYGFVLHAPGGNVELSAIRDRGNHAVLLLDAPQVYHPLQRLFLSYADGNVKAKGPQGNPLNVTAFGPLPVFITKRQL